MSKKRIMLVDDESGFTRLLRLTLPAYEVCEVNNPLKAVQAAKDFKPDINGAQLRSETLVDFRGLPLSFLEAETRIWRRGRVRYW